MTAGEDSAHNGGAEYKRSDNTDDDDRQIEAQLAACTCCVEQRSQRRLHNISHKSWRGGDRPLPVRDQADGYMSGAERSGRSTDIHLLSGAHSIVCRHLSQRIRR